MKHDQISRNGIIPFLGLADEEITETHKEISNG